MRICFLLAVSLLAAISFQLSRSGPASIAQGVPMGVPASPAADWATIVAEDFEGEFPGTTWTLAGDPHWSRESYRPHTGGWSGYCVGGGENAASPPGPYPNDVQTWTKYGPFDLTHATAAELLFSYWTDLDPEEDELFWGASKSDFLYWGHSAHGDSDGWQQVSFDLEDYLGEEEVWIAFVFESDAALSGEGVYIDDILLRAQIGPQERKFVYLPLVVGGSSTLSTASK